MAALRGAASTPNFVLRVEDVPAVLDALTTWNTQARHPLFGALDMSRIGMSGHSFGAVTTQAVSGQALPNKRTPYLDTRIDAAVIMSPSVPKNVPATDAFGGVTMPWLLMTGTEDGSPIGNTTVDDRLAVYPALPTGDKFELVLYDAQHSAFSERALPSEGASVRAGTRNPNHHRAILALSTAFWDAYVRQDSAALAWIKGNAPRSVLEAEDRWQRK
jgi:predicted dienelactone hydrolase